MPMPRVGSTSMHIAPLSSSTTCTPSERPPRQRAHSNAANLRTAGAAPRPSKTAPSATIDCASVDENVRLTCHCDFASALRLRWPSAFAFRFSASALASTFSKLDVAEPHGHRRAGVHLQREHAFFHGVLRVAVDRDAHQLAVDRVPHARADGFDDVLVPIVGLDRFLQLGRVADRFGFRLAFAIDRERARRAWRGCRGPARRNDAGVGGRGIDVGLVAADDPLCGSITLLRYCTPLLPPSILYSKREPEVADLAVLPDEERVVLDRLVGRGAADDRAVLDAPDVRVAFPAFEVFAVEDGFAFLGGVRSAGSDDQQQSET